MCSGFVGVWRGCDFGIGIEGGGGVIVFWWGKKLVIVRVGGEVWGSRELRWLWVDGFDFGMCNGGLGFCVFFWVWVFIFRMGDVGVRVRVDRCVWNWSFDVLLVSLDFE